MQWLVKILDNLCSLTIINIQLISKQKMIIASWKISDCTISNQWFDEIFLIADIQQPAVLDMIFLRLGNPDVI